MDEIDTELQAVVDRIHPILWSRPEAVDKRKTLAVIYVNDYYMSLLGSCPPLTREESRVLTGAVLNLGQGPELFDRITH